MKISLVIPVRNESRDLPVLLRSISGQVRPPDEVIFIDGGSTDNTADIITGYDDKRFAIKVFSIGDAYPGTARNKGVMESRFEFIAFTDAGIELDKDWLNALTSAIGEDGQFDIVYGAYMPKADTFFKQCAALAFVPPSSERTPFIASSLLKKSVWQAVGGFPDLRAAEDRIFMEKAEKKGFRICRNPDAMAIWQIPADIGEVYKRFYNYSYHDLLAGRWDDWHLPVLRMYVASAVFVILGAVLSPFFLLVPLLGLMLRTVKRIYINRKEPCFNSRLIPAYLVLTGCVILAIDMAMFAGWLRYATAKGAER
jgi:glycosyltransferase involved in cell wall biosynthesis